MKKSLLIAFALSAFCTPIASAAHKRKAAPAPEPAVTEPHLPLSQLPGCFSLGLEKMFLDVSDRDAQVFDGLRLSYDRVLSNKPNSYVTLNMALSYTLDSENATDYAHLSGVIGIDGNLKLGEQTYAYGGPRIGWARLSNDENKALQIPKDSETYFHFGIEVGIRYFASDRCNIFASIRGMQYAEKNDVTLRATSVTVGAGWAF